MRSYRKLSFEQNDESEFVRLQSFNRIFIFGSKNNIGMERKRKSLSSLSDLGYI